MKTHEISFYSQFKCSKQACPYTCCQGWRIVFDDESVERIKAQKGSTGRHFRRGMVKKDGMILLRLKHHVCPFLTEEKLCEIQTNYGEDYMPNVCVTFPRLQTNYELFAEEVLSLGCPEAVRLFLKNRKQISFLEVEKEITYDSINSNHDFTFLKELTDIRSRICDIIQKHAFPTENLYASLIDYAKALQTYYISHNMPDSICSDSKENLSALPSPVQSSEEVFTFSMTEIDRMLTSGFYHKALKKVSPFLYELCLLYFKEFDSLTFDKANDRRLELIQELYQKQPEMTGILRDFFLYLIQVRFLDTYENYSFLKCIRLCIMHTTLLELFCALFVNKHQSLSEEELILITSVYYRRACHNFTIEQNMYHRVFP